MTATAPKPNGRRAKAALLGNRARDATFLCYHSITDGGPPFLSLPPETFERQLAGMRRRGFVGGDLAALAALVEGRRAIRRHVFLTFDDGYVDNHDAALPLLAAYGFPAIVFVLPSYVDRAARFDWPEVAQNAQAMPDIMRSLDWAMVDKMAERGIEFGSHTSSHPHLTQLGDEALREELWSSRERLRSRLGRCDVLAYPFGEWNRRVAAAAAEAGYSYALSLPAGSPGEASNLAIPRINVDYRDRAPRFAAKLSPLGRRVYLSGLGASLRTLSRARRSTPIGRVLRGHSP